MSSTNNKLRCVSICVFLAICFDAATVVSAQRDVEDTQETPPPFMPHLPHMPQMPYGMLPMPMAFGPPPAPFFVPAAQPNANFADVYKQMFGQFSNDNSGRQQGSNSDQHDEKQSPPSTVSNNNNDDDKGSANNHRDNDSDNGSAGHNNNHGSSDDDRRFPNHFNGGYPPIQETPLQKMMRNNFNEIVDEVKEDDRRQASASQPVDWRRVREGMNRASQYYGMARTGLAVGRVLGRILWYSTLPAGPVQG